MSPNASKLALKLFIGLASTVVSVAATTLTEKALSKALHEPEDDLDVIDEDNIEPEEETQADEK